MICSMTERLAILFGGSQDGKILPVLGHTVIFKADPWGTERDEKYLWQIMENGEIIGVLVDE